MPRIVVSGEARADLADIRRFSVDRFGKQVADEYLRGFKELYALIGGFPAAGVNAPTIGPGVRSIPYRRHRVYYRPYGNGLLILRVLHHAQRVDPAMFQ